MPHLCSCETAAVADNDQGIKRRLVQQQHEQLKLLGQVRLKQMRVHGRTCTRACTHTHKLAHACTCVFASLMAYPLRESITAHAHAHACVHACLHT
eukprot:359242-Chlamydomonas_euryale.AAC.1